MYGSQMPRFVLAVPDDDVRSGRCRACVIRCTPAWAAVPQSASNSREQHRGWSVRVCRRVLSGGHSADPLGPFRSKHATTATPTSFGSPSTAPLASRATHPPPTPHTGRQSRWTTRDTRTRELAVLRARAQAVACGFGGARFPSASAPECVLAGHGAPLMCLYGARTAELAVRSTERRTLVGMEFARW
jgi:hypothetical protein